jgi:multisubunit Na+/H+ antiporter MnhE subunit
VVRLSEFGIWWLVLGGFWLGTLNTFSPGELVLAAGCAVPGAAVAVAARRVLGASWRPSPRWLRWLAAAAVTAIADTARVLVLPGRGSWRTIRLPDREDGTQAAATVALDATPGSVVADARPGELDVHVNGTRDSLLTKAVRR